MRARRATLDPGPAGGRRHRLDRRDDRRRRDAGGHQHPALPAAHHRRGPVAGADRAIIWLWTEFGAKKRQGPPRRPQAEGETPRVNIIGPIYGTFNMPSDLAEIRRLVEGIGCEVNMVFPLGSHIEDVAKLPNADVNICMYREFGRKLCEELDRPYLHAPFGLFAPPTSCASSASCRARPRALHRAREAHHDQADLGSLAQRHAGFLRHRQLRRRGDRDLYPRPAALPRRRDGRALRLLLRAQGRREARQRRGARGDEETPPLVLFGSYNERMYRRRGCGRAAPTSRPFPGAIIRRATGTPFMGFAGRDLPDPGILQRAVRRAVPHPAARHRARPRRADAGAPAPSVGADAQALLERRLETEPFLLRISPPSGCAKRAERDARERPRSPRSPQRAVERLLAETAPRDAVAHEPRAPGARARGTRASQRRARRLPSPAPIPAGRGTARAVTATRASL